MRKFISTLVLILTVVCGLQLISLGTVSAQDVWSGENDYANFYVMSETVHFSDGGACVYGTVKAVPKDDPAGWWKIAMRYEDAEENGVMYRQDNPPTSWASVRNAESWVGQSLRVMMRYYHR